MQVREVATTLYGARDGYRFTRAADLRHEVALGLSREVLRNVVQQALPAKAVTAGIYRVVPRATFMRRALLSPEQSERTERLARVVSTARESLAGDADAIRTFMSQPHPALEGQRPFDVSLTELGAKEVEALLLGSLYGTAF